MAGVGRGKNYSEEELKQLCYSLLHISQYPAVGNGQRAEKFWERVREHYNLHKPKDGEVRGRKSLEGKWADIRHDVAKFIGCYSQVEERLTSGTNLDDTLATAKELYKENHPKGKSFAYEGAWYILKEAPRWRAPQDDMVKSKSKRKSHDGAPMENEKNKENSSPDVAQSDVEGEDFTASKRPQGNKRAKEELKRAKVHDDALRVCAQAQREQAAATQNMAKANFLRARVMEYNSRLALLSVPIETMNPKLQAFMSQWKLEEAQKLKVEMQRTHLDSSEARSPPAPPRATRNPLPRVISPSEERASRNPLPRVISSSESGEERATRNPVPCVISPSDSGEEVDVVSAEGIPEEARQQEAPPPSPYIWNSLNNRPGHRAGHLPPRDAAWSSPERFEDMLDNPPNAS